MTIFNVFTLMGGIAMFLYGMDLMGKALEQTAGSKLQGILSTMTSSPIRGFLLGWPSPPSFSPAAPPPLWRSASSTPGMMELHQAISVIMGANVGTTVTGWLLSPVRPGGRQLHHPMLNPNAWSPIAGLHRHLDVYVARTANAAWARSCWASPFLMAGMNTMSGAMSPLADEPWFMDCSSAFQTPFWALWRALC